jgi:GTPase
VDELLRRHPGSIAVSARTGAGVAQLEAVLAERIPRPDLAIEVLVPFSRGDLVNRVHAEGDVLEQEHTGTGTRLRARVRAPLAAELAEYAVVARS